MNSHNFRLQSRKLDNFNRYLLHLHSEFETNAESISSNNQHATTTKKRRAIKRQQGMLFPFIIIAHCTSICAMHQHRPIIMHSTFQHLSSTPTPIRKCIKLHCMLLFLLVLHQQFYVFEATAAGSAMNSDSNSNSNAIPSASSFLKSNNEATVRVRNLSNPSSADTHSQDAGESSSASTLIADIDSSESNANGKNINVHVYHKCDNDDNSQSLLEHPSSS